jgi:glutathione S-transferase
MPDLVLVIGNRRYSSWSLRPWLALRHAGASFEEVVIPLHRPETKARLLEHAPSGKVPALRHGGLVLWESLAILEYLAELFPEAGLLPAGREARAVCRAVCSEMHAGFAHLRKEMPMDVVARHPGRPGSAECRADIARVREIWRDARSRFGAGGPFLFGSFGMADAMFAPVCSRFTTYRVELDGICRAYVEAVMALPAMREWCDAARAEPWVIDS